MADGDMTKLIGDARRARIAEMFSQGISATRIASDLSCSPTMVYAALDKAGIERRRVPRKGDGDKAAEKREARVQPAQAAAADRRRFKTTPVPMGEPANVLAHASDPVKNATTRFPTRVFDPTDDEAVLKDGSSNAKIGGDVLVGRLAGAHIVTLTLEERASCPKSCKMWRGCYGNSMQYARRWRHGPALEGRLREEVAALVARHQRVLVRLHVLGDFYSTPYVTLWLDLLTRHPGLSVFGFTAWRQGTEIGDMIAIVRQMEPSRFSIRHSGVTGQWGSFTLPFPTDAVHIGDAVVCPEQRSGLGLTRPGIHCGSCGLCWSVSRPIAFIEH